MGKWIWTETVDLARPTWICGIYKICEYDLDERMAPITNYRAYWKRPGMKCWGDHVDKRTPSYPTLKAAKAACVTHAEQSA